MKISQTCFVLMVVIAIISGCSSDDKDEKILGDNNDLVKVSIDLVEGFDGLAIIKIDEEEYFRALILGVVPFAGPQASFTTYLLRGEHSLYVMWELSETVYSKIVVFKLGNQEEYFISLVANEKELLVAVKDSPMIYF